MPTSLPAVSVIVPTFREAPNLRPLTERIFAALNHAGLNGELILVDDNSQDGTDAVVKSLQDRFPVRLVVRRGKRGLSGAVIRGFEEARADCFIVMDADLQHPPETIPAMIDRLNRDDCEFVLATRYAASGSIEPDWPILRRWASRFASLLARPLTPVTDPLSGFFALKRHVWRRAVRLNPIGYKIALELLVKARCGNPAEVPIQFAPRSAGASKAGLGVGLLYLCHLFTLYRFRFRWLLWAIVIPVILIAGITYAYMIHTMMP